MSKEHYAEVSWCVEDLQAIFPKINKEEAHEWLENNERHIQNCLIEYGWDIIQDMFHSTDD